jgi:hypothetical protein
MQTTTPAAITDSIRAACRAIAPGEPLYVPSVPDPDSRPSWCFDNVRKRVARDGGSIVHGWAIWQVPGLYVEAEHHGVWRTDAGDLVDISPQFAAPDTILFLPDPDTHYDTNAPRANRLFVDGDSDVSRDFVALAQLRTDIQNSYRVGAPDVIVMSVADQAQVDEIDGRLNELRAIHAA